MPQHQYELAGLTVLHMTQPAEGGVARVVTDLVRAQVRGGARVVVACPPGAGRDTGRDTGPGEWPGAGRDAGPDPAGGRRPAAGGDPGAPDGGSPGTLGGGFPSGFRNGFPGAIPRGFPSGYPAHPEDGRFPGTPDGGSPGAPDGRLPRDFPSGFPGDIPGDFPSAHPQDRGLAATLTRAGAEVLPWPARRAPGPGLAREVRAAARLVADIRPDLLHLHSAKAGLAGRLAVRGALPTVFQPHAWSYDAATGLTARAARRWERRAARWSARVLCVSETERLAGERAGIRADWSVVPNGVDTDHFTPVPAADRAAVRAALPTLAGLAPDTPLVVCVGRLCPQKGQDVLLHAWPEVTARLPGARLVLVGDGPDHRRLLLDAPEHVLLAGDAHDTAPWYRAADVVVQPSRWEGMALAPLEAMACGRPVVLTEVSGARESVPAADADGCVVPVGDEHALAVALLRLLTDAGLRTAAGLRALAHVRERHDVRRTTAAVAGLYRELLALPRAEAREGVAR